MFSKFKKKKDPSIVISKDETWCVHEISNSQDDTCDCKLHIGISIDTYKFVLPKLMTLLQEALCNGVIPAFKFSIETDPFASIARTQQRISLLHNMIRDLEKNYEFSDDTIAQHKAFFGTSPDYPLNDDDQIIEIDRLKEAIQLNEQTLISKYRVYNYPITIYLPGNCEFEKIASLCAKIEAELRNLPKQQQYLSIADLPLPPFDHISFRKESLGSKAIVIQDASTEELQQLQKAGLQSKIYESLTNAAQQSVNKKRFF